MARLKKSKSGLFTETFMYDGKRIYVRSKDKKDLAAKVVQRKKELAEGRQKQENPVLNKYYEDFTKIRRREQKESTLRSQRSQYKNIADVKMESGISFGEMRIKDITRRDIENVRQVLLEIGKSPENLNNCFAHLNHVFANAVLDSTIEKNPCKALKRLKRESEPISQNRHRALTEEETVKFLRVAEERNSYYLNVFKVMLLTGMRIGEVAALYVTDIDKQFIHVRRSVTRDEVGCYIVGDSAKTASGKRDIPMTTELWQIFRDQRKLNQMVFGSDWSGPLFQSFEGEILREYTVNREIGRICKQAEIERFTCHGMRATFATRFMEQRPQDFKVLSEIMGHKTVSMTLDVYAKVMTESKVMAMNEVKIKIS